MSKYNIGATWESTCEETGRTGHIWLSQITEIGTEIWRWSCAYSDGSGFKSDWGISYKQCREEIPMYSKFKRTK